MSIIEVSTAKKLEDVANPFRNFEVNPVMDDAPQVTTIVTSMKETGAWTKWMGRVVDKDGAAVLDDGFYDKLEDNGKLPKGHSFQIAYGHNSWRAAQIAKIKKILIDVRPLNDDTFLSMMIHENRNAAKDNIMVIIEAVKQTGTHLADSIAAYSDFKAYKDAGGTFFNKKAAFDNAKSQGIGFKTIHKRMEGWSASDIQNAHRVLGDLEEEVYDKDLVAGMPSITVLGQFSILAKTIRNQTWPEFFKAQALNDCAAAIADPAISTTAKILKNTISALKDGKDPLKYIKSTQRADFNLIKKTKDLVFENTDEEHPELKDLPTLDGFKDYEGLTELMESVQDSIKRTLSAREAGEDEPSDDPVEAATAAGGADEPTPDAALPELPPVAEEDGDVEMPIGVLKDHFIRGVEYLAPLAAQIAGRDDDEEVAEDYADAVQEGFNATAKLMLTLFDQNDVKKALLRVIE